MVSNVLIISLGVTSICLLVMLVFPYVMYARDMKDHLRIGKTFMESVTTTIIWHLLLVCFFAFFFGAWEMLASHVGSSAGSSYSPKAAVKAFLNIGGSNLDMASYWNLVSQSLSNINYGDTNIAKKSQMFISFGLGLIVVIALIYWVILFFMPVFCMLVPIFLSARYDKLHRDNNDGTILHKARYLVYGVAGYIILGIHFKINDAFIAFLAEDSSWAGLHKHCISIWKGLAGA